MNSCKKKDEQLEQAHSTNQTLREGLRQALVAIQSLQEQVSMLEGLITSQHEQIKPLKGNRPKIAITVVYPLPQIVLFAPQKFAAKEWKETRRTEGPSWALPPEGGDSR